MGVSSDTINDGKSYDSDGDLITLILRIPSGQGIPLTNRTLLKNKTYIIKYRDNY